MVKLNIVGDSLTEEPIYDHAWEWNSNRDRNSVTSDGGWSEGSWGSSEFEEYSDQEGYEAETEQPAPNKPLPQIPQSAETNDSLQVQFICWWAHVSFNAVLLWFIDQLLFLLTFRLFLQSCLLLLFMVLYLGCSACWSLCFYMFSINSTFIISFCSCLYKKIGYTCIYCSLYS